ncbi:MAG: hypothetical protein ACLS3U_07375 [Lachnospiraceae bacterium]
MRKVALSLMLAASMAATTLGSTAVFASDATTTESDSYTYRYALADSRQTGVCMTIRPRPILS